MKEVHRKSMDAFIIRLVSIIETEYRNAYGKAPKDYNVVRVVDLVAMKLADLVDLSSLACEYK